MAYYEDPAPESEQEFEEEDGIVPDEVQYGQSYQQVDLQRDEVEGTRDFKKAYDKLVEKFYHEEGANLMIPEQDLVQHELDKMYKPKFNAKETQRRIDEQRRKKEDKIRNAQYEKEMKELEECSFAPIIYTKKNKKRKTEISRLKSPTTHD